MPINDGLDNPLSDPAEDAFNRWPFSARLADTIANLDTRNGAPVIGIFGKWGYGKSTVLNYIKRQLETAHSNKTVLFEFNPWLFTNQEDLLAAFFAGLAMRLEESLGNPANNAGVLLQKYSGLFGMIPIVGSGASKFAEQLGKELSANSVQSQRGLVFEMMRSASRTVVVLIDDLDRLDRDEVMAMLKLVRLTANLPHVIYLLAFDDEVVARAIGTKYDIGVEGGRQFLQKIIQHPFAMPAVGHDRLANFVLRGAKDACAKAGVELSDQDWSDFAFLLSQHLIYRLNTPRQAIRYANSLDFALPLLKGEVDPFEQMRVEALRILFPELYTLMRDDIRSFTTSNSRGNLPSFRHTPNDKSGSTIMDEMVRRLAEGKQLPLSEIFELETGAHLVWDMFKNEIPIREKSIQYQCYFDRYFSYAVTVDRR
jgi:predicted KAP-like P-loop ATPase